MTMSSDIWIRAVPFYAALSLENNPSDCETSKSFDVAGKQKKKAEDIFVLEFKVRCEVQ